MQLSKAMKISAVASHIDLTKPDDKNPNQQKTNRNQKRKTQME